MIWGWPTYRFARSISRCYPSLAERLYGRIARATKGRQEPQIQRLHAAATVSLGIGLAEASPQVSMELNDEVIASYWDSSDEELRVHVAWAMVNKGEDLAQLGRDEEALEVYRTLDEAFPFQPPFLECLSQGLMNWALALDRLGRSAEEQRLYARIVEGLNGIDASDSARRLLAWALINWGIQRAADGQYDLAVANYTAVIDSVERSVGLRSAAISEAHAAALRRRSEAYAASGDLTAAIADAELDQSRYGQSRERGIQEEVACAMLVKALAFEQLGRVQEALGTYDSLLGKYRGSTADTIKMAVASALRLRESLERDPGPGW